MYIILSDSLREKFSLAIFIVAASFLILALYNSSDNKLYSLAIIGLLTSVTAGAFAEYLFQVVAKIEMLVNRRRFMRLRCTLLHLHRMLIDEYSL